MKKLLLSLFLLLAFFDANAATVYACKCDTGSASGCTPGSNTAPYDTPAKSINTNAQWKTSFQALAAGDHLSTCQGGYFAAVATGNMKNTNATATNPVVIDSYDDTARWSGGAGIKPVFDGTGNGGNAVLSFNQTSPTQPVSGYTIKDIEIRGDNSTITQGIFLQGNTNYVVIDNVKITKVLTGIQCQGATNASSGTGTGVSTHFTVRNSLLTLNLNAGILDACGDTLIEKSTFTRNGDTVNPDHWHDIYLAGITNSFPVPQTISSLASTSNVATLTTSAPHGIAAGSHFTVTVASAGTGAFNITAVGTVTGASTLTYPCPGCGTGAAGGSPTYTNSILVIVNQGVVRNNTFSEAGAASAGNCGMAHIVVHGTWTNLLIENNLISESIGPTLGTCVGIELDGSSLTAPQDFEGFTGVVVRDNTVLNFPYGIAVDLMVNALVENNYLWCSQAGYPGCLIMRSKGGFVLPTNNLAPSAVIFRYNTVYVSAFDRTSTGIAMYQNASDPLTGVSFQMYGNAVILGSGVAAGSQCFTTTNTPSSKFTLKDYNACYYVGSAPFWDQTSTLASIQSGVCPGSVVNECNSILTSSANVTSGQPFLLTPTTGPSIGTSSTMKNTGHPSLGPSTAWGGAQRNQGVRDIGAFEFGATLGVVPGHQAGTP